MQTLNQVLNCEISAEQIQVPGKPLQSFQSDAGPRKPTLSSWGIILST